MTRGPLIVKTIEIGQHPVGIKPHPGYVARHRHYKSVAPEPDVHRQLETGAPANARERLFTVHRSLFTVYLVHSFGSVTPVWAWYFPALSL